MAGFADILGSLVQTGMAGSGENRLKNVLGGMLGGGGGESGGGLGDMLSGLSGGQQGDQQSGGLGGMLSSALGGLTGGGSEQSGGLGGMVGDLFSSLGSNKTALGGLGALGGALLGGGGRAAKGAIGGGALALLASLAVSALKKSGQAPAKTPAALFEEPEEAELESEAEIMVRAMLNAAKADGRIDENEVQRIIGKLDDDGLSDEEKAIFTREAETPMDTDAVIASAQGRPEIAAQIYAASLLAIQVDTPAEEEYMRQLASGLGLAPEVVSYIEQSLVQ